MHWIIVLFVLRPNLSLSAISQNVISTWQRESICNRVVIKLPEIIDIAWHWFGVFNNPSPHDRWKSGPGSNAAGYIDNHRCTRYLNLYDSATETKRALLTCEMGKCTSRGALSGQHHEILFTSTEQK